MLLKTELFENLTVFCLESILVQISVTYCILYYSNIYIAGQSLMVSQEAYDTSQAFIADIEPVNHFSPPGMLQAATASSVATLQTAAPSRGNNALPAFSTVSPSLQGSISSGNNAMHQTANLGDYSQHQSPVAPSPVTATPSMPDFSHPAPVAITNPIMPDYSTHLSPAPAGYSQQPSPLTAPTYIQSSSASATTTTDNTSHLIYADMIGEPVYKALKADELAKIIFCRYCQKRFTFLSEHLAHMKSHTPDVESVSQMSINIWIQVKTIKNPLILFKKCSFC